MNERATRRELIDKMLLACGWGPIVDFKEGEKYETCAVREYQTKNGPADYLLFYKGEALAAVEAKKLTVSPQNVLSQAQRYSKGFEGESFRFGEFRIPFVYATNGEVVWFQDLRADDSRSRKVAMFHSPIALKENLSTDMGQVLAKLASMPVDNPRLRPYQKDAIEAIEQEIHHNKRAMLVAMATGTGKTFVAVSEVYRLLKAGVAKRILFLVDRRALAAQAVSAFSNFEPEPGLKFDKVYEVYHQRFHREDLEDGEKFDPTVMPNEYLTNPQAHHVFVYVSTIQRMRINLFGREGMFSENSGEIEAEDDVGKLDIPINAFDVIIADECHRGYTSTEEGKWREVLDHFDAVRIGLTATPAAHTASYFGNPVYNYDYQRAVLQKYLVDFDAVSVRSDITMKGLFLKPGEEVDLVDTKTGRLTRETVLEDERDYDVSQLEFDVTAPERNRKIVEEFAKYALEQEREFGRFPKTLVFAVNDLQHTSHADQLVNLLRDAFGRGDAFVQKITGNPNVDRPLQKIREFRNRPQPSIVVTVDMLTTGVDVPKIENLVFLRPVKSRILFAQMLGRGTRTCDEINKSHFTVFDCFGGSLLEYFKQATDFTADPPSSPTRTIKDIVSAIRNNEDRDYNVRVLQRRLGRIEKDITAEGRDRFGAFIPAGDIGDFAQRLPDLLTSSWKGTIDILTNPTFQDLMVNYPRAPRTFIVATGAEDVVSSEYAFRTTDGKDLKPGDYLAAFEKFVKENPDHLDALNILLTKPAQVDTKVLSDLRKKLDARPERFTLQNLRRAYQYELADIVSIIRHAASGEPLMSAAERVDRAIQKVKAGHNFNPLQEFWLQTVRDYLVENLIIERNDFASPPFSRHGGWTKAEQVFGSNLVPLLNSINEEMLS